MVGRGYNGKYATWRARTSPIPSFFVSARWHSGRPWQCDGRGRRSESDGDKPASRAEHGRERARYLIDIRSQKTLSPQVSPHFPVAIKTCPSPFPSAPPPTTYNPTRGARPRRLPLSTASPPTYDLDPADPAPLAYLRAHAAHPRRLPIRQRPSRVCATYALLQFRPPNLCANLLPAHDSANRAPHRCLCKNDTAYKAHINASFHGDETHSSESRPSQ